MTLPSATLDAIETAAKAKGDTQTLALVAMVRERQGQLRQLGAATLDTLRTKSRDHELTDALIDAEAWNRQADLYEARATSAEADLARLRDENERLRKAFGPIIELWGELCANPDGQSDDELVDRLHPMMLRAARAYAEAAHALATEGGET